MTHFLCCFLVATLSIYGKKAKLGSIAIGKALLVDRIMDRYSYWAHKLILYESLLVTHRVQRSIVKKPLKIKGTIDSAL